MQLCCNLLSIVKSLVGQEFGTCFVDIVLKGGVSVSAIAWITHRLVPLTSQAVVMKWLLYHIS